VRDRLGDGEGAVCVAVDGGLTSYVIRGERRGLDKRRVEE
jgi:hypothetical protein